MASSSTSVTGEGTEAGAARTTWVSWVRSDGGPASVGSPARTRLMSAAISSAD